MQMIEKNNLAFSTKKGDFGTLTDKENQDEKEIRIYENAQKQEYI